MDVADSGVPIRYLVSSASLRDRQAAIPRMTMTADRVQNLYDLMDSAYDAKEIHAHSRSLGPVPILDAHPRRKGKAARCREDKAQRTIGLIPPERAAFHG